MSISVSTTLELLISSNVLEHKNSILIMGPSTGWNTVRAVDSSSAVTGESVCT